MIQPLTGSEKRGEWLPGGRGEPTTLSPDQLVSTRVSEIPDTVRAHSLDIAMDELARMLDAAPFTEA